MTDFSYTLRPVISSDEPFLAEVYISTRWEELSVSAWPDAQKRSFLLQQFEFQSKDWARNYETLRRDIVSIGEKPVGRLYTDRRLAQRDIRVVDIALLPAVRGHGVATRIFGELFAEADASGWKVSIHVEYQNRAKNLYTRLGFLPARDAGVYLLMERPANQGATLSSVLN